MKMILFTITAVFAILSILSMSSCATVDLASKDMVIEEVTITPRSISADGADLDMLIRANIKDRTQEERQRQREEEKRREQATEGKGNYRITLTGKILLTIGPFPVIGSPTFEVPFKRSILINIPQLPATSQTSATTPSGPQLPRLP